MTKDDDTVEPETTETYFDDKFWHGLFLVMHRILVTADDFLCATLHYSRRPRGKWIRRSKDDP